MPDDEHPFGGAHVYVVRGSKGTIKQVMADAFLLIMAVSLGTISYLVAREVAKRIL